MIAIYIVVGAVIFLVGMLFFVALGASGAAEDRYMERLLAERDADLKDEAA